MEKNLQTIYPAVADPERRVHEWEDCRVITPVVSVCVSTMPTNMPCCSGTAWNLWAAAVAAGLQPVLGCA